MLTRRHPISDTDHNVNDMTPRRSTRVSSRSHGRVNSSAKDSSTSPAVTAAAGDDEKVSLVTIPMDRHGMVRRKRRVTLSPSQSPSCEEEKSVTKHESPSTETATATVDRILTKKRHSTDMSTTNKKKAKSVKIGRWEKWEQIAFLQGLREHGRGRWKIIAESIPTRSTVQVKTHAQVELKKFDGGFNIFEELDEYLRAQNEEAAVAGASLLGKEEVFETPKQKPNRPRTKQANMPTLAASTPIVSNKRTFAASAMVARPPLLAFSSSTSVTTTTLTASALARHSPRHLSHPTARFTFHPMLASTSTFPSSLLPFSHSAMAGVSFPFSSIQHPTADGSLFASSPIGSAFGAFEAANALLGLSTAASGDSARNDE